MVSVVTVVRECTAHNFTGRLLGSMQNKIPTPGNINPRNHLQYVMLGAKGETVTVKGGDHALFVDAAKMLDETVFRRSIGECLIPESCVFFCQGCCQNHTASVSMRGWTPLVS